MSSVFSTNNNNLNLLTKTVIPVSSFNAGIIYNGSYYLIGGNAVVYSSDSVKWSSTPIVISGMTSIRNFAWNNPSSGVPKINPFTIACGEGNNTLGYSPDGIYWKGLGKHIFSIRSNKALWNGILWTAIGSGGYWVATSYDGIHWTARNNSYMSEGYDIAWNGNMFIAVGSGEYNMATSVDGIYWSPSTALSQIFSDEIHSIQWTGKIWIATGSGKNTSATSNDGYNWQSTNPKNLIITDASNVFSNANASSSVTASSLSATYLATNISDNSMNPTSSTEWRSNTNLYNASSGIYRGTSSTTYNNTLSASGEWLQLNAQTPLNIIYYHISWFIDVNRSHFTIPKEWYLLGSNISTGNWNLIDHFNYNTNTPPINITSNKFVIKLQNIYSNNASYQYYRIVFRSIFPGGSQTFTRVSELDLFYENENSNIISRYIKPIITPTHVLYQTNIIPFSANTGKRIVYQVTDLYGNLVTNNRINNGSIYNSIVNGLPNTQITSGCFDGENYIITSMSGNVCYMNTQSLNTNFNFDTSLNNIAINDNISGNVYSSCFNGQRIVLAGTGGNVITYSPIISKNPNGQFVNSLNANSLFSTVYGVASNSGYGPIYIPNRIYFNPDEKITVVGPKSYNKAITSSTCISLGLNNYVPQTNVSIPTNTIIYGIMGPYGERGIVGEHTMGSMGEYGYSGLHGVQGPYGPDGCHGDIGEIAETGVQGVIGNEGPTGPRGHIGFNGFNGFDGLTGTFGPTGPKEYGPVDEKLWNPDLNKVTTNGNVFISSTSSPTSFDNALNIVGNLNTNNELTTEHIQLNNNIVTHKFVIGKPLDIVDLHPYVVFDISGNVSINNKLIINSPSLSSNTYSCDVSGIVYTKRILKNNIMTNYSIPSNISENTITIDFDKSNTFYVDIGNTITSNFTCILNNYNFHGFGNVLKIKMVLDYKNASFERYFCKFVNINGIDYTITYTQGDPIAIFSNSLSTNLYIQNLTIITSIGGGIWKVICDSVFYSN